MIDGYFLKLEPYWNIILLGSWGVKLPSEIIIIDKLLFEMAMFKNSQKKRKV